MPRILAVSDLHVRLDQNKRFVEGLRGEPDDWLIVAGDVGESESDLRFVLDRVAPRFARVFWVPGNHELWTIEDQGLRGERRYLRLVSVCREYGTLTPEDPYVAWPGDGPPVVIAPLFLLYDYTFRPDDVPADRALAWAEEEGIMCQDELVLHPDPYPSRIAWCRARVMATRARLDAIDPAVGTILINHFPLRREHAFLPRIPRFSIWCGTRATEDWHVRYRARAVVFGHLHIRQRRVVDGVPFHEVSLGYSRQWDPSRPERYVHTIWPATA